MNKLWMYKAVKTSIVMVF